MAKNPTTRILALLELLQAHGLLSGAELARRLAVDPRTLRRYILALESLGIPVVGERGRDGGYRLMQGFKLPPMVFSNDEAVALALGLVAASRMGLASTAIAAASALAKLERVMPESLRKRMRALGETVQLDRMHAPSTASVEVLATLSAAAQNQQRMRLRYRTAQAAQTDRDVDPYGLAYLGGHWYAIGYCHLRQDRRSFRLDRILAVALLPQSFARPANFDAMAYMNTAIATLPRAHSVKVLLHADLATAQAAIFTALGVLEVVSAGTLLHSQADDLHWMARQLAGLPFAFTIAQPAALADALLQHASALRACAQPVGVRAHRCASGLTHKVSV